MDKLEIIARMTVREGQLESCKRQAAEMIRIVKEKDTKTLRYEWFLSDDQTKCEVREAYVNADALVDHALHIREARDALFAESAYDHRMAFYGELSPRLLELVTRIGVTYTAFGLLQALEPVEALEPAGVAAGRAG